MCQERTVTKFHMLPYTQNGLRDAEYRKATAQGRDRVLEDKQEIQERGIDFFEVISLTNDIMDVRSLLVPFFHMQI